MPNLQNSTIVSSTNKIRFIRAVEDTSVDGPGLRTSLYFAGCEHHCPGCHNSHTWPKDSGRDATVDELMDIVRYNDFNVTFSGGDPIYQAAALVPLASRIKAMGKTIWCYTGFTYEDLRAMHCEAVDRLLELVDVLVDGPFIEALKDESLRFRGSSNQRIIDLDACTDKEHIVLWNNGNY